jgi:hypothetical protein
MTRYVLSKTLACGLALACLIFGQTAGSITGIVTNIAGEPVTKAAIQATNAATNAVFTATTSARGAYVFPQLPVGTYNLSSGTPGFRPFAQPGVVVEPGKPGTVNLSFEDTQLNTLGDGRDYFASVSFGVQRPAPTGPTPRLPDGRPDFSGVWYPQRTVDPGKPELTPRAQAIKKQRDESYGRDSPQSFCLPLGVLQTDVFTGVWRVVHSPGYMVTISEGDTPGYRQFWLDGRSHPKDFGPTWNGHSIGR